MYFYYTKDTVALESILKSQPTSANRFFSEDGVLIAEEYNVHRIYVTDKNVPQYLKLAFISAEDKSFYDHPGFDFKSIIRATSQNIYNYFFLRDNSRLIGASTITQQLIKNLLNDNERTFERKLKEIIYAIKLERSLSKEKILELYLNEIYLGRGAFGVVAASEKYFGKTLNELDIEEMALLAALPKAPSNYDPQENYEAVKERRDWVLDRMAENGVITKLVAQIMQDSKINYVDKDLYSKPILLDRSIADKVQSNLYFDANTDRNYGLTYFLTINQNATDYVSDQLKKLKEMQNQVDLRADIRIISLISGRTLVDIQDSQKNTKNYKININERSILRPIYFGGIIGSGVDLNKKLLSTKIDTADTYPSLVTVRKLFSSSTDVADQNLKDNAEVYLLEYLKDKMQGSKLTYSWDEKIELNLDDVLSLFIPILTDGLSLETYYVDKIDDMNGNQIYLHKDDGKGRVLKSEVAFKVKSLFCDMEEIEISKNNKYAEPGNCFYYHQNEDKLFYLKFTGNVAFFAIISGVNLQKEDYLITSMNDIASGSLDLVDKMQLNDFLIPDEINAQQINKKTGSRYNYTSNYVWEFF
tara:strand:+ start:1997 stop:3757 length:1761 start_codon:yes stop_codon:yes gene_type:complete